MNAKLLITMCVLLAHYPVRIGSKEDGHTEDLRLLKDLVNSYTSKIRPTTSGKPTEVTCNININSFDSVSESSMDYEVTIFLRQAWNDPRLCHNASKSIVFSGGDILELVWVPDLFFTNAKEIKLHQAPKDNLLLRIYPNGDVLYSLRLSMVLSCYMYLGKFPMDEQACNMQVESYSYSEDEMILSWWNSSDPVEIDKNVTLPQYSIDNIELLANSTRYITGNYSNLSVNFILIRSLGFYVLQAYIPSSLLVALSWLSVWVEISAAPARVALGVTTVLALVTQATWLRSQLPKVAYATAIDVWMVACQVLVFAALLEYSVVYYLYSFEKGQYAERRKKREFRRTIKMRDSIKEESEDNSTEGAAWINKSSSLQNVEVEDGNANNLATDKSKPPRTRNRVRSKIYRPYLKRQETQVLTTAELMYSSNEQMDYLCVALGIDRFSRVFLPLVFVIFCICYWIVYPISSKATSQEI
ncbi:glycine receptor subunit alpha-4-like isoform X2 [Ptychodera flava]|uniref:glycine receptor subunit alpha-4-like isoform X2 n=1 Tax=Ptychodera flava TaxID=63121 RepID=UPI003969F3DC